MKHIIFLFVLSFFLYLPSAKSQTYIGLSGGGGIASEMLFRASIPVEWKLKDHLSLQIELTYVHRENRDVLVKLINDRRYTQSTISYVDMPVLIKPKLNIQSVNFYALGGVQFGYGIKLAANYTEDRIFYEERFSFEEKEIYRFDLGINLGLGIEKKIRNDRKIFLDYRVYFGLFDIDSNAGSDIFNQGQGVTLGFMIPLGASPEENADQESSLLEK